MLKWSLAKRSEIGLRYSLIHFSILLHRIGAFNSHRQVLGFSAVASATGIVFGTVTATISTVFSVLAAIGSAVFGAIGTIIAPLLSPIRLVIIAIGAVAGACYLVYRNFSTIENIVSTVFSNIVSVIQNAATSVYRFFNQFTEFKIIFGTIRLAMNAVTLFGNAILGVAKIVVLTQ